MRKGSYVAALAVAGLLVVGCKDDSDTTAPPATPSNDEVQRQVDDATRVLREETSDLGQNIKEQASAAGAKLNQQVEQATQGLDAESSSRSYRQPFRKRTGTTPGRSSSSSTPSAISSLNRVGSSWTSSRPRSKPANNPVSHMR